MTANKPGDDAPKEFTLSCPIPPRDYPHILLGHGGGGKLTQSLIEKIFVPAFANPYLETLHDGAVVEIGGQRLAYTTDSYVVQPLFFPGGDIGKLAIYGTVNDLAMCGARPLFLSVGMVLEEGLPMDTLWRVACSMREAAQEANVQIVTGDTKVVDRGKGDQIFINTSGVGLIEHDAIVAPDQIRAGDVVVLSGDIGRHGMAIMASREGLEFESTIESDAAPLAGLVLDLFAAGVGVHCLRDLTRGGMASALIEIAASANRRIEIEETAVPVRDDVRGACEILGLDPFYVANEGRFVVIAGEADAEQILEIMRVHPAGSDAVVIGRVLDDKRGLVTMKTAIGGNIILDMFSGEQLPRIC